jgi:hypothetical protein
MASASHSADAPNAEILIARPCARLIEGDILTMEADPSSARSPY